MRRCARLRVSLEEREKYNDSAIETSQEPSEGCKPGSVKFDCSMLSHPSARAGKKRRAPAPSRKVFYHIALLMDTQEKRLGREAGEPVTLGHVLGG